MSAESRSHWRRVHEYVLGVCEATQSYDFFSRSVACIDRLIGCVAATALVAERDGSIGEIALSRAVAGTADPSLLDRFNARYRYLAPSLNPMVLARSVTDFSDYERTPYVDEFIRPNGWWSSAYAAGGPFLLSLFRSKGDALFSTREIETLRVITQHLNNHFRLLTTVDRSIRPRMTNAELAPHAVPLTRREVEIVHCLVRRMTAREIAVFLGISPRTVEQHIANMYEKLDVHCRQSLVRLVAGQETNA